MTFNPVLFIQKGANVGYKYNIDTTIKSSIEPEKVQKALEILNRENKQDSNTYKYIEDNKDRLFVWGAKDKSYGVNAFEDVQKSIGSPICFVTGDSVNYIGIISSINDVNDRRVNSQLSTLFWDDAEWVNIWFIKNIKRLTNYYRSDLSDDLNMDIFEVVFGGSQQDNIRRLDDENCDPEKLNKVIERLFPEYFTL